MGKNKSNLFIGIVVVAIIIVLAIVIFTPKQGTRNDSVVPTTGPIKIGGISPLSGDGAVYGLPIQKIVDFTLDEINDAGGVNGREVQILWEDGKCNPKDGLTAAQTLVNVRGMNVIIGGVCSGETLGAADFIEENKVILFSPGSSSPDVTYAGDYIFRDAPSDSAPSKILAEYVSNNYESVAIISEITDYAQAMRRVFKENLKGVELVADETFSSDQRDIRTQLTKIKESNSEALLILPQTVPTAGIVVKQASELEIDSSLFGNEIFAFDDTIEPYSQYYQGLITAKVLFDETLPKAKRLIELYNQHHGEDCPLGLYCGFTYDSVYIVVEAIEKCDGTEDTDCIKNYLYSIENWEGASGTISIDEYGDVVKDFLMQKIVGEEFITI